jgi:hypothetical protein
MKGDPDRAARLFQQLKDDPFFGFSGSGIQDGADGLHVLALSANDFSKILLGHGKFDDDTLLAFDFVYRYLLRSVH